MLNELISGILQQRQTVAPTNKMSLVRATEEDKQAEDKSNVVGKDFDSYLESLLAPDAAGEVNEEELFAALTQQRVKDTKGEEAAKKFAETYSQKLSEMQRWDGKPRVEDSALAALKSLVADKTMTAEEGDTVFSQAFAGAQLDDNKNALFDSTGGDNDPTRAVAKLEAALLAARTMVTNITEGKVTDLPVRSLNMGGVTALKEPTSPDANGAVDGTEGFLWKPVSENQKRLAILLPKEFTYNIDSVRILDAQGNEVERGTFSSYGEGGPNAREKYNFSKKGGEYPRDVTVEMVTKDGQTLRWQIPDPAQRYD